MNKPIETLAERQHVQEYLPIFPDAPGPSRMNTTYSSPAKCGSAHSTPNFLASSPDSGIPQSSPQTPISFQGESPAITSQPTTPSPLPRTFSTNPNNIPSNSTAVLHAQETLERYETFLESGTESLTSNIIIISLFLLSLAKSLQTNPMQSAFV